MEGLVHAACTCAKFSVNFPFTKTAHTNRQLGVVKICMEKFYGTSAQRAMHNILTVASISILKLVIDGELSLPH